MHNLRYLNVSSNQISVVPSKVCFLPSLNELAVTPNPLIQPPGDECGALASMRRYYEGLARVRVFNESRAQRQKEKEERKARKARELELSDDNAGPPIPDEQSAAFTLTDLAPTPPQKRKMLDLDLIPQEGEELEHIDVDDAGPPIPVAPVDAADARSSDERIAMSSLLDHELTPQTPTRGSTDRGDGEAKTTERNNSVPTFAGAPSDDRRDTPDTPIIEATVVADEGYVCAAEISEEGAEGSNTKKKRSGGRRLRLASTAIGRIKNAMRSTISANQSATQAFSSSHANKQQNYSVRNLRARAGTEPSARSHGDKGTAVNDSDYSRASDPYEYPSTYGARIAATMDGTTMGHDLMSGGQVLSREELIQKRKRNGECPTCGAKCFKKKLFKLEPITVPGKVFKGRCLSCIPQDLAEGKELMMRREPPRPAAINRGLRARPEDVRYILGVGAPVESNARPDMVQWAVYRFLDDASFRHLRVVAPSGKLGIVLDNHPTE